MNIDNVQKLIDRDGIVFLSYGGFLTQTLIAGMTEVLEKEAEFNDLKMGTANSIFTIFIELSQNIMNYSNEKNLDSKNVKSEGLIFVSKDEEGNYYIHSQNIISNEDKERIEIKLKEISSMNKDELKYSYRELRKTGKNSHEKGGGIGFYEIAKKSSSIKFEFNKINDDKYYFYFMSTVNVRKEDD